MGPIAQFLSSAGAKRPDAWELDVERVLAEGPQWVDADGLGRLAEEAVHDTAETDAAIRGQGAQIGEQARGFLVFFVYEPFVEAEVDDGPAAEGRAGHLYRAD